MAIRQELARRELARRELARRELERREEIRRGQQPSQQRQSRTEEIRPAPRGIKGVQALLRNILLGAKDLPPPLEAGRRIMYGPPMKTKGEERAREVMGGLISGRTLGVPQLLQKIAGIQPEAVKGEAPLAKMAGQMIGFAKPAGMISKGAQAAGRAILPQAGILAGAGRGALTGAAVGAVYPPDESWPDIEQRGKQALAGALIGGATGVVGGVVKRRIAEKQLTSVKGQASLSRKMREAFHNIKSEAVNKFGGQVDDLAQATPGVKTSGVREIIDDINTDPETYKPLIATLRKIPGFDKMLANPKLANEVPVGKIQGMINHINTKIPKNIKFQHLEIMDLRNNLKAAQLNAFPQMAQVRAEYAKVIQPWQNVKQHFKFNRVIKGIEGGFGGAEGEEAVKGLFPPEVLARMGGMKVALQKARNSQELLKHLLLTGAGAVGGSVVTLGALKMLKKE